MKRDIAIIGISGKFPKSNTIKEFWNNLVNEKELVHFFTDKELEEKGVSEKKLNNPDYVKASSFINSPNEFDYPFFKYTLDEAKVMNPQTRILHQLVWKALEDAGCNIEEYNKKIGIFVGANNDLNWSLYSALSKNSNVDDLTKSKLSNPNFMASLISYKLNLRGPCYFLDTACSTSLSAAHLACRSLLLNECGTAVVGGIRVLSYEDNGYLYQEGSIESKDGHIRSFDANSSGTIGADGAGVVILKRLEDAIKEKDNIYAVIKGSAINNDGSSKGGYTMPSIDGQSECIKVAQKIAGVHPTDITYMETHGTGTKIGDLIEIESLNIAFNHDTTHKCAIGTVKSNMGHADEAAGIIGLIKTALAIRHKVIPASLHYKKPNPAIDFSGGPFFVNTKSKKWETTDNKPLMAGINSLGIGGTNVHMILGEPPLIEKSSENKKYQLIRISANSIDSLEKYEFELLSFLNKEKGTSFSNLAYTLQKGRKQFNYKKYFVAQNTEQLIGKLKNNDLKVHDLNPKNSIVFMFSGQGSQYFNMGYKLYNEHKFFRQILDEGFDYLFKLTGINYTQALFGEKDILQKINHTEYTQPILFLFEYAMSQLLINLGIKPDYLIGHSLGEYVAACISEVFTLEDALKLICKRAELMTIIEEGAMLSIGTSYEKIDKSLISNASVAAINSPNTFVLSGSKKEITQIKNQLDTNKISFVELKTSHAFHSEMMKDMLDDFEAELKMVKFSKPKIPFISNITGELILGEDAISIAYWKKHIIETVNFKKGIEKLISFDNTMFIEIGPGNTLTTFYKQCQNLKLNNSVFNTIRHPKEEVCDVEHFLNFLGFLWCNGFDISWEKYYEEQTPQKISIPTYVFDSYDLPAKVSVQEKLETENLINPAQKEISDSFYMPSWKYNQQYKKNFDLIKGNDYLLFSDESSLSKLLKDRLLKSNKNVIEVLASDGFASINNNQFKINPNESEDYQLLKTKLDEVKFSYDYIIYGWELNKQNQTPSNTNLGYKEHTKTLENILRIIKSFNFYDSDITKKFVFISDKNCQVTGRDKVTVLNSHINTLLCTLAQECSNIYSCNIDLDLEELNPNLIEKVFSELENIEKHYKVAYRNGRRWIPYLESVKPNKDQYNPLIKSKGVYLITGGLDYTEYVLACYLLKKYQANIIIFGVDGLNNYNSNLNSSRLEKRMSQLEIKKQRLEDLKRMPGNMIYSECDVSDYNCFLSEVKNIENKYGEIKGVIHTARNTSVEGIMTVDSITSEAIEKHFTPRVGGIINICKIFKNRKVDFVKIISSLSSFLGGIAYGTYASASTLMDDFVLSKNDELSNWSIINLDRILEDSDKFINGKELLEVFEKSFSSFSEFNQLVVSKRNIELKQSFIHQNNTQVKQNASLNRTNLKSDFKSAKTPTEKELLSLFEDLFGIQGIGIEDDFFDLGGDSLKGMMLINKIDKVLSIKLSISDIFSNTSIATISYLIDEKKWLSEDKKLINELII